MSSPQRFFFAVDRGLLRDAEKQFKSALKDEEMVTTHLELCKVYLRPLAK